MNIIIYDFEPQLVDQINKSQNKNVNNRHTTHTLQCCIRIATVFSLVSVLPLATNHATSFYSNLHTQQQQPLEMFFLRQFNQYSGACET